ncbi:methionine-S-sulfoxide reductase [Thiovulum sp. ES]|nr:methionine-S-sulfoxide reductase [Thiovulum sp. ES]
MIASAFFAAGCFWGVEFLFQGVSGVKSAESGYMGGTQIAPSYEDVIYRNTGHLETVKVDYNPEEVSYEELVKFFFEIHDFTQTNGQGPDIGFQYLSGIFYQNDEEKKITENVISTLENRGFKVATKLIDGKIFYRAEDYHQNYYNKTGKTPYCHSHRKIF